jgi:hypothetical protein
LVPQAVDSAVPLSTAPLAPAGFSVLSHLNADAGTGISAAVKAIMELTSSAVRQENNGCDIGTAPCEQNPPDILSQPGDRQPSFPDVKGTRPAEHTNYTRISSKPHLGPTVWCGSVNPLEPMGTAIPGFWRTTPLSPPHPCR